MARYPNPAAISKNFPTLRVSSITPHVGTRCSRPTGKASPCPGRACSLESHWRDPSHVGAAGELHTMTAKLTNRPTKFVFVNRYYEPDESASSQMLTDLARALAVSGLAVYVVCSRQLYGDPNAQLPRHENLLGVTVHRVATTRFGRTRLIGRAIDYASFYASA